MNSIIVFLKENISYIQDFMEILFTGIATIIGVLTYKRAKNTILQPIRNEVIKEQAKILKELLEFTNQEIDYLSLLQLNVYIYLEEYGFVMKSNKEFIKKIKEDRCGSRIITNNSEQLKCVEVLEPFSDDLTIEEIENAKKEKYLEAKKGIVNIEQIYFNNNFYEYNKKLDFFINNPFMPKKFITILKEIKNKVNYNSGIILKEVLENFFTEYIERVQDGKKGFNIYGLYNAYHRKFVNTGECVQNIREETRKYLFIDYEWK